MTDKLKKGDKVTWSSSQGEIRGTVRRKLTSPANVKGHTAQASPEAPQYEVSSDKTGAHAIHKPGSLHKK